MFYKIICRLFWDIGIFLQKDWILTDFVGNFVLRIFRIFNTEGKV